MWQFVAGYSVVCQILVLTLWGIGCSGASDSEFAVEREPELRVPNEIDLGSGDIGDELASYCIMENNGHEPVTFSFHGPSCKCTKVDPSTGEIAPGSDALILITRRLPSRREPLPPIRLTVVSDDPSNPRYEIRVVARWTDGLVSEASIRQEQGSGDY
jgi:hypothetical protein